MKKCRRYYVHVPPHLRPRPLLLVPAAQVRKFIQEINRELEATLSIPEEREMGLLLDFNLDGVLNRHSSASVQAGR